MIDLAIQIVVAPALAGVSTLAARRWGDRAGGLVSSFPAIVGPLLLVTALAHSGRFTAQAAHGVVLGLVALAGSAAAYGLVATLVGGAEPARGLDRRGRAGRGGRALRGGSGGGLRPGRGLAGRSVLP